MPIKDFCTQEVVTVRAEESLFEAARRMSERGVGTVVVIDAEGTPIGMLTDRDITVKAVADGKDPRTTLVREVMHTDVVALNEERGVFETIRTMREQGIRRIPIVNSEGRLSGIISLDDLIMLMGEEMANLSGVVAYGASAKPMKKIVIA